MRGAWATSLNDRKQSVDYPGEEGRGAEKSTPLTSESARLPRRSRTSRRKSRLNRQLKQYLDICVRCAVCKDACHQYSATGD